MKNQQYTAEPATLDYVPVYLFIIPSGETGSSAHMKKDIRSWRLKNNL